ncbi:hypothetical protein [Corallococcus exiguus]|uniref:hypothetical protein n=1 Tax=Corallococcus exiguus TaxID=83462 RepID=UPI00111E481C|nr:hypothetical protein [Corallococcus exiguus]TNV67427.1 hypothetical protein FH620_01470 [Corallococcus exiguus]
MEHPALRPLGGTWGQGRAVHPRLARGRALRRGVFFLVIGDVTVRWDAFVIDDVTVRRGVFFLVIGDVTVRWDAFVIDDVTVRRGVFFLVIDDVTVRRGVFFLVIDDVTVWWGVFVALQRSASAPVRFRRRPSQRRDQGSRVRLRRLCRVTEFVPRHVVG